VNTAITTWVPYKAEDLLKKLTSKLVTAKMTEKKIIQWMDKKLRL